MSVMLAVKPRKCWFHAVPVRTTKAPMGLLFVWETIFAAAGCHRRLETLCPVRMVRYANKSACENLRIKGIIICLSLNVDYIVLSSGLGASFPVPLPVAASMFRIIFPLLCFCLLYVPLPVSGDVSDHLWGGRNEETSYSPTFVPGMGGVSLAQYQQPSLGAPQPAIPVQAGPHTQAVNVPQANIPTITIPAGQVGSVGQPATFAGTVQQAPSGAEIVYIMPSSIPSEAVICVDGVKTIPATEVNVVPATTPGAIPVALKTVTVQRPKVEYHWTYAPIVSKRETLVHVVDPRSGRVVRSFCQEDAESSCLPWLHRREVITYETVEAKVAVPVSLAPSAASTANTYIRGGLP